MDKMSVYNNHKSVPQEAIKPINAGRLKGMSDINPMWRIKALTEEFGPCGTGWRYQIDDRWKEEYNGEVAVFVQIGLQYLTEVGWSEKVIGIGGSKLLAKERTGPYFTDEAYKMATTDAISVACKQLGIGADVYWKADATKYTASKTESMRDKMISQLHVSAAKYGMDEVKISGLFEKTKIEELTDEQLTVLGNKWEELKGNAAYRKDPQPEHGLSDAQSPGNA